MTEKEVNSLVKGTQVGDLSYQQRPALGLSGRAAQDAAAERQAAESGQQERQLTELERQLTELETWAETLEEAADDRA